MKDYSKHDHTHCFDQENPPCGQKIKHFECCLCKEPHPEIAQREEVVRVEMEKERWCSPCPGCKDGHPSFWKTVVESPQWELWEKEQVKNPTRDIDESRECGWMGPGHFQEFLAFISKENITQLRNTK
jgi:hypothetical protein